MAEVKGDGGSWPPVRHSSAKSMSWSPGTLQNLSSTIPRDKQKLHRSAEWLVSQV